MNENCYRRLLAPNPTLTSKSSPVGQKALEDALVALGKTMVEPAASPLRLTDGVPPSGYTYLGQFIDHDLTHDPTPLDAAGRLPPEQTPNARTPGLDLDHLYGARPGQDPNLYVGPVGEARFLVAPTTTGRPGRDVPRDPDHGGPLTGDGRREENVILSQLTAVFLRLHNAVLERTGPGGDLPPPAAGESRFAHVRRLVTWHYQWIVLYDFLPQIIQRSVWAGLLQRGTPDPRFLPEGGRFALPVEFTLAGFRYGHSVVRNSYPINPQVEHATLEQLINPREYLDFHTHPRRLRDEWAIEWKRFFEVAGDASPPIAAARFDTRVPEALHHLPDNPRYPALPVRTLLRGARVGLPSGQELAREAGVAEPLTGAAITTDPRFTALGFDQQTPLFFYVLREAERLGQGRCLGPAGSWLVGETLYAALHAGGAEEGTSFLRAEPGWRPPLGERNRFAMAQLLRASGL